MKEPKNIEELFKESFNGFEADPGANAWSNIQSQLNAPVASASASTPNNGVWLASSSKLLTTIIAASIIGISVAGYFYFDSKGTEQKNERISKEQVIPVVNDNAESEDASVIENSSTESTVVDEHAEEINSSATQQSNAVQELNAAPSENKVEKTNNLENTNTGLTNQTNPIDENIINEPVIVEEDNSIEQEKIESATNSDISNTEESAIETTQQTETPTNNTDTPTSSITEKMASDEKSAEDKVLEPVFKIPNIFTPNHDNVNDVFEIEVDNADEIQVQIFNNAGKLIHHWTGEYGFWDGRNLDDTRAPTGVYFYKVVVTKDGKTFPKQGNITLTR